MRSFDIPLPELTPVELEARSELHGRLDKSVLRTRRVSVGQSRAAPLRPEEFYDKAAAEFLRQEAVSSDFWLLSLTISFYPDPDEPIDSAAVGLLLTHDSYGAASPAVALSIWPARLSSPSDQSNSLSVTAKLGFVETQASRTTTRKHDNPFLLGLGEGQSDPEWRFRRSPDYEIEGIYHLSSIIRAPRDVRVVGAVTIAASIRRRVAGLVRYRAILPPELASVSLPPHR